MYKRCKEKLTHSYAPTMFSRSLKIRVIIFFLLLIYVSKLRNNWKKEKRFKIFASKCSKFIV